MSRYTELEDGSRLYKSGIRYRPKTQRPYNTRRPDDPRAVRFGGDWFLPLEVLPDEERGDVPPTRPDEDAYEHMLTNLFCKCDVCKRPQAEFYRRRWRRKQGLRP